MEFQLSISNSKRWCCESAVLNMSKNMENSTVATGLEKVSFHSSPKEKQCQRMLKLPYGWTHFTCQQGNAQNPSSQDSIVYLDLEKAEKPELNCQHPLDHKKAREVQKNIYFCFIDYAKAFDCVDHKKLWKILKEMKIPDHLTCLFRNLNAG